MPVSSSTGVPSLEIPAIAELAKLKQWVNWKLIDRAGKPTKIPIDAKTGEAASVDKPQTWATFQEACSRFVRSENLSGVGFVFTADDPYCGVDFDKCRNPETGILTPYAQNAVNILQSYTEVSPSGTGVHVLGRGALAKGYRNDTLRVECYSSLRYFSITGVPLASSEQDINDCQEFINQIIKEANQKSRRGRADPSAINPDLAEKIKEYLAQMPAELDPKIEPPADKMLAFMENSPQFAAAYRESLNTEGAPFPSASNRDFALASHAAGAGWGVMDILGLLISARRLHKDDLKLRRDYYGLTIGKIMEGEKLKKNADMSRDQILLAIGTTCGTRIKRIVKYLSDPPLYEIQTVVGNIKGEVDILIEFRSFRKAMASAANIIVPSLEKEAWEIMAQQILRAAEEEDVGAEATDIGQTITWIREYLRDSPAPKELNGEAIVEGHPFFEKSDLYVCMNDMERWLRQVYGSKMGARKFGVMLKSAESYASQRDTMGSDGRLIARSVWKVPAGIALEVGGQKQ